MRIKKVLAAVVVSSALSLGATTVTAPAIADTVTSRTRGPTADHNPIPDWAGYCTWATQELVHVHAGYFVTALTGNAELWAQQAQSAGWTVVSDAQPRSIAVFSSALVGGVGHVAWVDAVDGGALTITEM